MQDYDPKGDYVRTWLPELKDVPPAHIIEPWLMSKEDQARCETRIHWATRGPLLWGKGVRRGKAGRQLLLGPD